MNQINLIFMIIGIGVGVLVLAVVSATYQLNLVSELTKAETKIHSIIFRTIGSGTYQYCSDLVKASVDDIRCSKYDTYQVLPVILDF